MMRKTLIYPLVLSALLLASCSKDEEEGVQPQPQPQEATRWECILFGSYPANEVVCGSFTAVDDYALLDGDVITDAALYSQLEKASWTDDDTEIGGQRYHRINASGTVSHSSSRAQHYRWSDTEAWHYFAYAPIKWRILKQSGDRALLLADRMPDTCPFNYTYTDTSWDACFLRRWLNSEFLGRAFTPSEREAIEVTSVKNDDNFYFGTDCGPDTQDRVFVLSESETFSSPLAVEYGFTDSDSGNDPARRFRSTLYAKCRGAWWSPVQKYYGVSFWCMRSIGYTKANVVYVGESGDTYNRGTVVTCNDAAVLPAITIDLSKASYLAAEPVFSTDIQKEVTPVSEERYTGDTYQGLHSPWVKDPAQKSHFTRWECILFGSYPANEVVSGSFTAVDDYALADGDVITDAALYSQLEQASWTDDETEIGGQRYLRLKGSGTITCSTNREQHYRWTDAEAWHYFAYAPIKWRILKIRDTQAVLLADRMPDTCPFHDKDEDVNWSVSHLRQWLNGDFLSRAFSEAERQAILVTSVENAPNLSYGTSCGPDTQDRVFILSNKEVFASPLASDYGFYAGSGVDDPARRFRSTLYAKCRGAWWSSVQGYRGNSFWFMRTNGYTPSNITYVCDFGYLYNQGTAVTCDDAAVLPAITIDLSKADYLLAPAVASTDVNGLQLIEH